MLIKNEFQRYASPNERRTISREDVGFYHAVIIGATYDLHGHPHVTPKTFFYTLTQCIEEHPWLCVVVGDKHTDKAFYERVENIDLERHISICDPDADKDDTAAIQDLLEANLDAPFPEGIPPWKIVVLPLRAEKFFIAFVYSHTIGDGISGPCFHKTFLKAFGQAAVMDGGSIRSPVIQTPVQSLPAPFDSPERLPISWSFLLKPLLAVLVPKFLARLLSISASASTTDQGTWLATRMFFNKETTRTRVRIVEIDLETVNRALQLAREHDTKLTAVIHQLINRALSQELPDSNVTNFVSQTAINMRKSVGIPEDEMGEFVSGCYATHARAPIGLSGPLTDAEWTTTREMTQKFALAATRLQDQPIGLLRYLPSVRGWTLGKIGGKRECSYEVSNIGCFVDQGREVEPFQSHGSISRMVFSQPGHVIGPLLCFNVASVRDDDLSCTVTWQEGALGIKGSEGEFVERICRRLKDGFEGLGGSVDVDRVDEVDVAKNHLTYTRK